MAAIEIQQVSKRFGSVQAVADLSFTVEAGRVTGFLGPNGAGKSTTLRVLLGLVRANAGVASFDGRRYEQLAHPSAHVGAVLEEGSFHPGRTGRNHLRVLAAAGRHPSGRVDEVLEQVGLTAAANRRVKGYSMGMRQRLAIAAALLGDPDVLILDEPANGLDPPGIRWMRDLLRTEAGRGRAVLVSSHLLSEVAQSVDDVVVIARGRLRASGPLESVLGTPDGPVTRVRSAEAERLAALLRERGLAAEPHDSNALLVRGSAGGRGHGRGRASGRAGRARRRFALPRGGLLRAHGGRGVTALLEAELLKLRTTRTFVALAAIAVATSVLIAGLTSLLSEPTEKSVLTDVFTSDTSSLFILILAIVGITGEWRHRTITSSLLAAPDRLRFLAAKTLAFAAAGLILSLLIAIAVSITGFAVLSARDLPVPEAGELAAQSGETRSSRPCSAPSAWESVPWCATSRSRSWASLSHRSSWSRLYWGSPPTWVATARSWACRSPCRTSPPPIVGFDGVELFSPALAALAMLAWIGAAYAAGGILLAARRRVVAAATRGPSVLVAFSALAARPCRRPGRARAAGLSSARYRPRHRGDSGRGRPRIRSRPPMRSSPTK